MEQAPDSPPLRRHQYRLRTLLIVVTLVSVLLGAYQVYLKLTEPPTMAFFRHWAELHNGDTLARVQQVLGPGEEPPEHPWIVTTIQERPQDYPAGLENGDTFWRYKIPGYNGSCMETYVQFRQGKLVNHDPRGIQTARFGEATPDSPKTQP